MLGMDSPLTVVSYLTDELSEITSLVSPKVKVFASLHSIVENILTAGGYSMLLHARCNEALDPSFRLGNQIVVRHVKPPSGFGLFTNEDEESRNIC